jgi:hypothetical protein
MKRIKRPEAEKIHARTLDIATYPHENGKLIVEGILKDERFCRSHQMTGETRPPGILHHMVIRMVVAGPDLVIEDVEAAIPQAPRDECRETAESLQPVIGMSISAGFTNRVKAALGGPSGCSHLVALLLAMASAAVQGFWSDVVRKPYNPADYARQAMDVVLDTCHVWRSDGPTVKEYREKFGLDKETAG